MKKYLLALIASLAAHSAFAAAEIGKPAPDFSAPAASGKSVALSSYKGNYVVLEWTNPGCPFVRKFYNSGAMQELQKKQTGKGIIWLSINSGAKGKEGNMNAKEAAEWVKKVQANPTEYLLDEKGEIGHLYGAKTTPHMFVIDKQGILQYAGAIDDKPSPNPDDIETSHNYVIAAINSLIEGKKVEVTSTQSYGCNVKY